MKRFLPPFVEASGLAALLWIGAGVIGSSPLAAAVTLLIAAVYVVGVIELRRYRADSRALATAIAGLPAAPPELASWLEQVPASLRQAVRRRIEGSPAGLPAPGLSTALAGLLVLLGMLGTFLGMVITLRGTGVALDSATDLRAVRASLALPVQGLGLAFGTSVAGVATSAALGLLSALSRRERAATAQALDACIATTLRAFSPAHRHDESLALLRQQAAWLPGLVDRLDALTTAIDRRAEATDAALRAGQDRFHDQAGARFAALADAVGRSLDDSLAKGARQAAATLQPAVEATLAGIAAESRALHGALVDDNRRQSATLALRLDTAASGMAETWQAALAAQSRNGLALAQDMERAVDAVARSFAAQAGSLVEAVAQHHLETRAVLATAAEADARRSDASRAEAAAAFEAHGKALLQAIDADRTHAAARHDHRLAETTRTFNELRLALQQDAQAAGARTLALQERLCDNLARTGADITAQAEQQARGSVAAIGRLVDAAAQAPRLAAELIAELRGKLSDSLARDNALLDERSRTLDTLGTLLDAVNRAATEQRGAIDALVASAAEALERAGARFGERVDAEAGKLAGVGLQMAGGAAQVARLGETFGAGVDLFSQSNETLIAHLQRIDETLGKSIARSDDQLAYYVAQAREVIDLSMLSQRQIVQELQRLAAAEPR